MKSTRIGRGARRVLAVAGWCLVGCSPELATPLNFPPRALTPRRADQVEMFMTELPKRPYAEVALIQGSRMPVSRMRDCAGELGCDALYVEATHSRGICLVYTDPAEAPGTKPPPPPSGLWAQGSAGLTCPADSGN
jgi:hypothetical protein